MLSSFAFADNFQGLWVVRSSMVSKESIDKVIDYATQHGYTDLFVQVRGRGFAFYHSNLVPLSPLASDKINPLDYVVKKGHEAGLKIHAWLNVYLLWSASYLPSEKRHIVNQQTDWVAHHLNYFLNDTKKTGTILDHRINEGIYLSPANAEVEAYLLDLFGEVIQYYDVDGIHLDYVRYQDEKYDFNPTIRQKFQTQHGYDPVTLFDGRYDGDEYDFNQKNAEWQSFRSGAITQTVKYLRRAIRNSGRQIALSAAVKPDPNEAKTRFGQDWVAWIQKDYIDFAIPMNYTADMLHFNNALQKIRRLNLLDKVYMGLATYNQNSYEVISKIYKSRANGVRGFCIFSYDNLIEKPRYTRTIHKALQR